MEAISDWHLARLLTVIWEIGPKWLQWSSNNASPDIRLPSREPREGCCLLYMPFSCCYDKNAKIKENYRRVYLGLQLQRDKSPWWRVAWQQAAGVPAGAES